MRIFLSWSGNQSREVAVALYEWLPVVLPYANPWLSDVDIGAGDRWSLEVGKNLEDSNYGIVCLTRDSLSAPWLLFEAGALAKSLSTGSVCPYLLDVDYTEINGPLAQFQAKKAEEKSTFDLICSINKKAAQQIEDRIITQLFRALWPDLNAKLNAIREKSPTTTSQARNRLEFLESTVAHLETRLESLAAQQKVATKELLSQIMPQFDRLAKEHRKDTKAAAKELADEALAQIAMALREKGPELPLAYEASASTMTAMGNEAAPRRPYNNIRGAAQFLPPKPRYGLALGLGLCLSLALLLVFYLGFQVGYYEASEVIIPIPSFDSGPQPTSYKSDTRPKNISPRRPERGE